MQDPAVAEPERDVVAVADEVAAAEVGRAATLRAAVLLLVGVARDEPAEPAVGHVHEPGAVDARASVIPPHSYGRAEVGARLLDRVALARDEPSPFAAPPSASARTQPG